MHGSGLCGGNQLHANGTWDNGISLERLSSTISIKISNAVGGAKFRAKNFPDYALSSACLVRYK
jgi:hypothetical protein